MSSNRIYANGEWLLVLDRDFDPRDVVKPDPAYWAAKEERENDLKADWFSTYWSEDPIINRWRR